MGVVATDPLKQFGINVEEGTHNYEISLSRFFAKVTHISLQFSPLAYLCGYSSLFYVANAIKAVFPLFSFQEHLPLLTKKVPPMVEESPHFNQALVKKTQEIAKKMGIEGKVTFYDSFHQGSIGQATGHAFSSEKGIALHPVFLFPNVNFQWQLENQPISSEKLRELFGCSDEKSLYFLTAHELAHVKNNDIVKLNAIRSIVEAASAVLLESLFGHSLGQRFITTLSSLYLGLGAFGLLSRSVERRADIDAAKALGKDGVEGGIKFFKGVKQTQLAVRNNPNLSGFEKWKTMLQITDDGDVGYDLVHPSYNDRIQTLSNLGLA